MTAVRSAGVELSVSESGPPDGPPVVLLHGLSTTREYVLMKSTLLERNGFRVIGYDARGHGRSSPPDSADAYGYDLLLQDLIAVMDALEVGRALLVGASMGSHTALRLALEHPDRVAGIVAVTPAYDSEAHPDEESVARADELAAALRRDGVDGFVETFELPAASPTRVGAFQTALRRQLERHEDLGAVAHALEHVMRARPFGPLADLGTLRVPSVVVASRDEFDRQHPYAVACKYAELLPRSRLVSETPGSMPLAWNGPRLSKLALQLARETAW